MPWYIDLGYNELSGGMTRDPIDLVVENLELWMAVRRMNAGELADASKKNRSTISQILNKRRDPLLSILKPLAEALDIPVHLLLWDRTDPRSAHVAYKVIADEGGKDTSPIIANADAVLDMLSLHSAASQRKPEPRRGRKPGAKPGPVRRGEPTKRKVSPAKPRRKKSE